MDTLVSLLKSAPTWLVLLGVVAMALGDKLWPWAKTILLLVTKWKIPTSPLPPVVEETKQEDIKDVAYDAYRVLEGSFEICKATPEAMKTLQPVWLELGRLRAPSPQED